MLVVAETTEDDSRHLNQRTPHARKSQTNALTGGAGVSEIQLVAEGEIDPQAAVAIMQNMSPGKAAKLLQGMDAAQVRISMECTRASSNRSDGSTPCGLVAFALSPLAGWSHALSLSLSLSLTHSVTHHLKRRRGWWSGWTCSTALPRPCWRC